MEYHDQPLQFISSHYFQIKDKDDNYDIQCNKIITTTLAILSTPMMLLTGYLTIKHMYPAILYYVEQYTKVKKEDLKQPVNTKLVKLNKKRKRYYLLSLFFTSCVVTTLLVTLHIFSITIDSLLIAIEYYTMTIESYYIFI